MTNDSRPIQVGGMLHAWQSPDAKFRHALLQLDPSCEPDPYPGIVVICDARRQEARLMAVRNLRRELPHLLQDAKPQTLVYWSVETNDEKRLALSVGLTEHPQFIG